MRFSFFLMACCPGCRTGIGKGNYSNGAGGGAGHGGRGGSGFFNGMLSEGGQIYGSADLPCELGSGTEAHNQSDGFVAGGGLIGEYFKQLLCFSVADV